MNTELKRVLCKLSLQCGMTPDRKVVPRFVSEHGEVPQAEA